MEGLLRTRVRFAQWAVMSGVVAVLAVAAVASAQSGGDCYAGRVVAPGERCTYPGTSHDFWVDDSGRGNFIFFRSGGSISLRNSTLNGLVYNFSASKQADGTWLIEVAGTTTAATTTSPTTTPTTTSPTTTPTTTSPTTTMRAGSVAAGFVDVMEGHPVEAIEWAAAQGITLGCEADMFCPDEPLQRRHARVFVERFYDQVLGAGGDDRFTNSGFTRARMMALLHSMAAPTTKAVSAGFVDVMEGHPVEAIEWAAAQGITLGCEADMFCPDEPLQRRHARVFVERFYDQVLGAGGDDRFTNSGFTRARMMALLHTMVGSATSEEATTTPTSAATTTAPTTTTRSNIPPNPGNTKNCSDFNTQAEAQAWFDRYYPHYGDVARLDGNNDGVVCVSLPKRTTTATTTSRRTTTTTTAPTTTTSTVPLTPDDLFEAELTQCEGTRMGVGNLVNVTVRGTITAKRAINAQWLRMQGGISMGNTVMNAQSINLNRFRATRSGSTWTIESLP